MTSKILVIDDERGSLALIKIMLNRLGYSRVVTTHDPQTGIRLFYSERPDLVLVDDMMPNLSGLDVCKIIKSDPNTDHIPVVIMSASTRNIMEIMDCGAADVLVKPFLHVDLGDFVSYFVLPDAYY